MMNREAKTYEECQLIKAKQLKTDSRSVCYIDDDECMYRGIVVRRHDSVPTGYWGRYEIRTSRYRGSFSKLGDAKAHIDNALLAAASIALIERMKSEILTDIQSGQIPGDVASFSALHDHVDANEYVGLCEEKGAGGFGADKSLGQEKAIAYVNAAQTAVHEWLASGRPAQSA